MSDPARKSSPNEDLIRSLANLLNETGLTEIEIEENNRRVRVARAPAPTYAMPHGLYASARCTIGFRWRRACFEP